MITKQFQNTVAILALAAMTSVTALAGNAAQKVERARNKELLPAVRTVHLRCSVDKLMRCSVDKLTKTEIVLNIVNSTADTIPRGTTIYWQVTQKVKGSFALGRDLAPGKPSSRSVKPTPPGSEFAINAQGLGPDWVTRAWYYKRQFRAQ